MRGLRQRDTRKTAGPHLDGHVLALRPVDLRADALLQDRLVVVVREDVRLLKRACKSSQQSGISRTECVNHRQKTATAAGVRRGRLALGAHAALANTSAKPSNSRPQKAAPLTVAEEGVLREGEGQLEAQLLAAQRLGLDVLHTDNKQRSTYPQPLRKTAQGATVVVMGSAPQIGRPQQQVMLEVKSLQTAAERKAKLCVKQRLTRRTPERQCHKLDTGGYMECKTQCLNRRLTRRYLSTSSSFSVMVSLMNSLRCSTVSQKSGTPPAAPPSTVLAPLTTSARSANSGAYCASYLRSSSLQAWAERAQGEPEGQLDRQQRGVPRQVLALQRAAPVAGRMNKKGK